MTNRQMAGERVYGSMGQRIAKILHACKARLRSKERGRVQWLSQFIPANGVVLDIGAHFGYLTKEFARLHHGSCRVYAFEPLPYNFSILRAVTARLANVTRNTQALSDANGVAEFVVPVKVRGKISPGLGHLGSEQQTGDYIRHTVETLRLDDFAQQHGMDRIDFIKIDIEGAEWLALRGGTETLRRFKPTVYAEVDDTHTTNFDYTPQELFDFMHSMGYAIFLADTEQRSLVAVERYTVLGDYLFRAER